jgi:anti-sigma factor (TIGR02949 family)
MMKPMLDCDTVMRQLWDFLDGELSPDRMEAIHEHLAMCKRCYPQYEFERAFLDAVANARREHSNPSVLRERIFGALRAEGFAGA